MTFSAAETASESRSSHYRPGVDVFFFSLQITQENKTLKPLPNRFGVAKSRPNLIYRATEPATQVVVASLKSSKITSKQYQPLLFTLTFVAV
jgi:hypothetical protein